MKTNVYYIPVQLGSNFREHAQEIPQEKIDTKNVLKIEDIIDIQDYNEDFENHYIYGRREKAMKYIDFIDPDYDEGYFFIIAARNGDIEMLNALIEKGREKDLDITNSIQEGLIASANARQKECVKMLVDNGANPGLLAGTSIYSYINECASET